MWKSSQIYQSHILWILGFLCHAEKGLFVLWIIKYLCLGFFQIHTCFHFSCSIPVRSYLVRLAAGSPMVPEGVGLWEGQGNTGPVSALGLVLFGVCRE